MPDHPRLAKNAAYGFTYLWYIFGYWLGRDKLWIRNLDIIIIFLLFVYLFKLFKVSWGRLRGVHFW